MKIAFTVTVIVFFIAACTGTQHLQPANADLAVAQQRVPGITLNDLQYGYKIYVTNCSGCHRLHDPKEYTASQWKPVLLEMFEKAKMHDAKQRSLIANYLIAKGKAN